MNKSKQLPGPRKFDLDGCISLFHIAERLDKWAEGEVLEPFAQLEKPRYWALLDISGSFDSQVSTWLTDRKPQHMGDIKEAFDKLRQEGKNIYACESEMLKAYADDLARSLAKKIRQIAEMVRAEVPAQAELIQRFIDDLDNFFLEQVKGNSYKKSDNIDTIYLRVNLPGLDKIIDCIYDLDKGADPLKLAEKLRDGRDTVLQKADEHRNGLATGTDVLEKTTEFKALLKRAHAKLSRLMSRGTVRAEILEQTNRLAFAAQPAQGTETNTAPPDKMSKSARALAVLQDHPDWTNKQIAEAAGVNVKSLSRMDTFCEAREILKTDKSDFPKGSKNAKTGDIEAWNK